jgi:hypothetical protein
VDDDGILLDDSCWRFGCHYRYTKLTIHEKINCRSWMPSTANRNRIKINSYELVSFYSSRPFSMIPFFSKIDESVKPIYFNSLTP